MEKEFKSGAEDSSDIYIRPTFILLDLLKKVAYLKTHMLNVSYLLRRKKNGTNNAYTGPD